MRIHHTIERPAGVGKFKFQLLIWKRWFDTGYGITNYAKYLVVVFGATTQDLSSTSWLAALYTAVCVLIGWVWYEYDFIRIDTEIGNQYNPFVKDMRDTILK